MTIETTSPAFQAIIEEVRSVTIQECKKEFKPRLWISVKRACEKLDIKRQLLQRLIDEEKIKAKHIGKSVRISVTSIDNYMNE